MSQEDTHTMVHVGTNDSGADEWYCPTCGRRFLMQWPPHYKRVILNPGDETVSHSGGKGGVNMGQAEVTQNDKSPDQSPSDIADETLAPWLQWMDDVDFENLWNSSDSQ
ncbi:MAG: hypothetical protein P4L50_29660 [Anaerolineaceae bacterium]|nr:hypothetical protein [Anaerolineaceae bacterium]